ncbi:MAG: energy-coupling factor transporter transmembrane component T family protein [Actinomycetota bacterium]
MDKYNLDPRTKITIVLCLSSIAVFVQSAHVLGAALAVSVAVSLFLGASLIPVIKSFKKIWYLFFIITVAQSLFGGGGRAIISVGGFDLLSTGGLVKGLEFILRLAVIVVSATIITTSTHREIVQGLIQLKIPYEIAFMVSVAIRFLPIFINEFRDTVTAIQLRGVDIERIPFGRKLRMYYYIFNPILINSIKKAHKLSLAMEMRAFRAYPKRSSYLVLKMRARDYIITWLSILFTAGFIAIFYLFIKGRLI